jgi:hypothetical protein
MAGPNNQQRDPDSKDETASTTAEATKQKARDEMRAGQIHKAKNIRLRKEFEAGTLRSREKL